MSPMNCFVKSSAFDIAPALFRMTQLEDWLNVSIVSALCYEMQGTIEKGVKRIPTFQSIPPMCCLVCVEGGVPVRLWLLLLLLWWPRFRLLLKLLNFMGLGSVPEDLLGLGRAGVLLAVELAAGLEVP